MSKIERGNAGEWSEPYVLFRLLADGKIYDCDGDMNIVRNVWHDVRSVLFKKNSKDKLGSLKYVIEPESNEVSVFINDKLSVVFKREVFNEYATGLKESIVESHKTNGTVDIPDDYVQFLLRIGRESLKASSKDTPDIWIDLPDVRNTMNKPLGFSIKSRLGSPSTIFNSSEGSNIIYEIVGDLTDERRMDIEKLLCLHNPTKSNPKKFYYPDYSERIKKFKEYNLGLNFVTAGSISVDDDNGTSSYEGITSFQKNLKMIDGDMPEILAFLVADSFFNGKTRMRDLVKNLNDRDPLGVSPSIEYPYYEKKIKDMLVAMTLSMTAIETWGGEEGTNGGMIIVKENGDVVCYHIFDRNDFRDFLFKNTKFERPDNSRYFSMGIVDYGGKHLIPLNVQIRMDHSKTTREKTDIRGYYDFEKGEYIEKESSNIERWIQ